MLNLCIILFWLACVIWEWHLHTDILEHLTAFETLKLELIIILFAPFILIGGLGATCLHKLWCNGKDEEVIAVVQFGEIESLVDTPFLREAANVDWYFFNENEDREFAINDLKEHYKLVVEVKGL